MSLRALYGVPAPAKINLFLHVVGRRPDGLHRLQSLFVLVDWCDALDFERRTDGALRRQDRSDELPADDLCLRAARLLQSESDTAFGVDISIDKRVPSGAGMGGGSSDAASTLLALNRLWGLRWPRERLLALGARLGADVPFFIGGHNAFVEGVGEQLTPVEVPREWFAIVKPAASLSTADVFADPALVHDTDAVIVSGSFDTVKFGPKFGRNDLQAPAQRQCPEVASVAGWLEQRFGNSRMTGSGSAVFARAGMGDQPSVSLNLQDMAPGWVGRMCRSLACHPLARWAD